MLRHSLFDLLLAEIKRNVPTAGYMANFVPKLNRSIVKDTYDKLK
jgi:hypothetical protein